MLRLTFILGLLLCAAPAFAAPGTCPTGANYYNSSGQLTTLSALGITQCYYASKSIGSDTAYDGSSETVSGSHGPFAHVPNMYGCASNCAVSVAAGTAVILRGGDTWTNAELGIYWPPTQAGTSSHPIYIGIDPSWYSGASWARPIFNMGGSSFQGAYPGNCAVICDWGAYTTFDNIELTGMATSGNGGGQILRCYQAHSCYFYRMYSHGWSHASSGDSDNATGFTSDYADSCIAYSIFDGSDTTKDMLAVMFSTVDCAYGNYIGYVSNGFEATGTNWHDNWVNYTPQNDSWQGTLGHLNAMFLFGPDNGNTSQFIYNNVISNAWQGSSGSGSGGGIWLNGNMGSSNPTLVLYGFNNASIANNAGWSGIGPCSHSAINCGTYDLFNNTLEAGSNSSGLEASGTAIGCGAGGTTGQTGTCNIGQNHLIGSSATDYSCQYMTCTTPSPMTADVTQSMSTANSQGYTEANGFYPQSGSASTVGAGGNLSSICTTIAGLNVAAGAACTYSTGFACAYNTSNHTMSCPAITENARPSSGAWDAGAYEYSASGTASPPTCSVNCSGTYAGSAVPTFVNPNSGTTIMCYTTNGGTPATNGSGTGCTTGTSLSGSSGNVTVSTSETVKVVAGVNGESDSSVLSETYTITTLPSAPSALLRIASNSGGRSPIAAFPDLAPEAWFGNLAP